MSVIVIENSAQSQPEKRSLQATDSAQSLANQAQIIHKLGKQILGNLLISVQLTGTLVASQSDALEASAAMMVGFVLSQEFYRISATVFLTAYLSVAYHH